MRKAAMRAMLWLSEQQRVPQRPTVSLKHSVIRGLG